MHQSSTPQCISCHSTQKSGPLLTSCSTNSVKHVWTMKLLFVLSPAFRPSFSVQMIKTRTSTHHKTRRAWRWGIDLLLFIMPVWGTLNCSQFCCTGQLVMFLASLTYKSCYSTYWMCCEAEHIYEFMVISCEWFIVPGGSSCSLQQQNFYCFNAEGLLWMHFWVLIVMEWSWRASRVFAVWCLCNHHKMGQTWQSQLEQREALRCRFLLNLLS